MHSSFTCMITMAAIPYKAAESNSCTHQALYSPLIRWSTCSQRCPSPLTGTRWRRQSGLPLTRTCWPQKGEIHPWADCNEKSNTCRNAKWSSSSWGTGAAGSTGKSALRICTRRESPRMSAIARESPLIRPLDHSARQLAYAIMSCRLILQFDVGGCSAAYYTSAISACNECVGEE